MLDAGRSIAEVLRFSSVLLEINVVSLELMTSRCALSTFQACASLANPNYVFLLLNIYVFHVGQ